MPDRSDPLGPSPASAPPPGRSLDISAIGLDARDRAVLVSMTRMLDGHAGLRLRWVEDATACTTLFLPHDWSPYVSPPRVPVRVTPRGAKPVDSARGLSVGSPLRIGEITEALEAAAALYALARDAMEREHARMALHALRDLLVGALIAGERRRVWFGLSDGQGMVVDFRTGEVTSSLSQAELLARPLQLAEPVRAPDVVSWPGTPHPLQLSTLLWAMTHALIDQGVSPHTINGRYRLFRMPEAAALSRPNTPRLVTAWTQRAMSVGEAAAAGKLSAFEVLWFLGTALALGLAVPAESPTGPTPL